MLPVVLDISRSISRAGRDAKTGIDRVEQAYWEHFTGPQCRFLARVPGGVFLLDSGAGATLYGFLCGQSALPLLDLRARATPHRPLAVRQAEAFARRVGARLSDHAGKVPFLYLNVGHSNLDKSVVETLRRQGCAAFVAMIHDTIPLDHPEFASQASVRAFPAKLEAFAGADLVICNSHHTRERARHWLGPTAPPMRVAWLGIEPRPRPGRAPVSPPRFATIGTIEPRKNHALLLDVWRLFRRDLPADQIPHLDVVGARGWNNRAVFGRLASDPLTRPFVHELGPLSDAELAPLLGRATALLFPSLAEGFGLPVAEARQACLPVICSDLPALREAGGNGPLYLPGNDPHIWAKAILDTKRLNEQAINPEDLPRWDQHFALVEDGLSKFKTGLGQ